MSEESTDDTSNRPVLPYSSPAGTGPQDLRTPWGSRVAAVFLVLTALNEFATASSLPLEKRLLSRALVACGVVSLILGILLLTGSRVVAWIVMVLMILVWGGFGYASCVSARADGQFPAATLVSFGFSALGWMLVLRSPRDQKRVKFGALSLFIAIGLQFLAG